MKPEDRKLEVSPLTDSQLGIYLECMDETGYTSYLIPLSFEFEAGTVDPKRLSEAFGRVANTFTAFSTVIKTRGAEPVMALSEEELPALEVSSVTDEELDARKKALFVPFSFDGNLLWRGEILCSQTKTVLALVFHHTVFDGSSIGVLGSALSKAYSGEELSESNTMFDAKRIEDEILAGEAAADAGRYFENHLGGLEGDSNVISDKPKGEPDFPVTAEYEIGESADRVKAFAHDNGVTENIVFLSAFSYTLAKFNNQSDVVFSSVESGRFGGGYENSIGMFVKSFPLHISADERLTASEFVKQTKTNFFDTLRHNHIGFTGLIESYPGCADVHFIYQGELFRGIPVGGALPFVNVLDSYEPVANLDVLVFKADGVYSLWIGYKNALYTRGMIDAFADLYMTVLSELLSGKRLCEFNLLSKSAEAKINEVNDTDLPFDRSLTVNRIFAETASKFPHNTAVKYGNRAISYSELDDLSARLASYISSLGIGRDDFVSVLIPRNEYMAVCSLGIIRAGAAYEPLDPSYPKERLNFMVSDCGAKLLIADRELYPLTENYGGKVLFTDEIDTLPKSDRPLPEVTPDSAFLLIYTSGTTGTPKGCILENRNIVAFHMNHREKVELSESSRVATIASFGFDAAAMDIFTTIMSGGELCIIPEEIKLDIPEVEKFYRDNGITNGFMTTQLGRMFLEQTDCKTLRHFVLGGEKLVPFTPPEWVRCHNFYGPSETIAYICGYTIKDNSSLQPIGRPNGNTKLYIVDSHGRLLGPGAAGELCAAGLQVGRGYYKRPEKTAEVFVPNPYSEERGYEKLYKTGDIVRMLPDGNMDFIGRRDGQVKIRGFRIELTEVEQVIREFEGIKNATVQAYDDGGAGKFIGAFIVSDRKIDINGLNAFILSRKPPYMVPAVTVQIDSIPVNANGKVDRRKLPKPERRFEASAKPENGVQSEIFDFIAGIVGTKEFGIDTDIYEAGLSSIGSIKLCSLLADRFGVTVQMRDIKENGTVRRLEAFVCGSDALLPEHRVAADYPLTKTQEGIFVECISRPDSTFYNIPLLLKISDKIDLGRLKTAVSAAVSAHPYILSELFTDGEGHVRQRPTADGFGADGIEVVDGLTEAEISETAVSSFALTGGRLFRIRIYRSESTYLFLEFHHIIADGTSILILLRDIEKAYRGENLSAEVYNGFDLSADEEDRRNSPLLDSAKSYYSALLEGLDSNFLPGADRLMSGKKSSGIFKTHGRFADADAVKSFCENNKISVNGLLCSAFGFVLAKYAGTDYSVFSTVYNGRNDSRAANTFGMLVKTLPVVCNIEDEDSLGIAKRVSSQLVDSMTNDLYSFAEISKDFGLKSDIVFVYQGDSFGFDSFCGETAEDMGLSLSESKAPLTLQVAVVNGKLSYTSEYSREMYTESLISAFLSAFDRAVCAFVNGEKTAEISLLTPEMSDKMDEYNATECDIDTSVTICDLYFQSFTKHPDKLCVSFKEREYTYSEAFRTSEKIAAYLSSEGIGRGDVVSILIHRDENMVLCAHGVIMTGAAYLGLDPTYPRDRLDFMLSDSGAKILICDRRLACLAEGFKGKILYTDEIAGLPSADGTYQRLRGGYSPEDTVLYVYSSGTTGLPKGAMLTHKNIVYFFQNYSLDMDLAEHSNIATYASFGFDGGAMDVFCSPMAGASLYVIPDEIRLDMKELEQFYIQNRITSGFMTTQVGSVFIGNTRSKSLTHFIIGGEKFIPAEAPETVRFFNGYGPSETMCYVNHFEQRDLGELQPIGTPGRNIKEYILDKFGNRLPFGAAGELCIASGQTGLGYHNRPEKTAEVFVKNPFCSRPPYDRMYRTGDIVRLNPDGNYVFVGRRDGQVKIRGFRIELSEVEQRIRQFDGIANAVVEAFDSKSGGKFLASYIVSDRQIDVSELNAFIAAEKPDYMVPAVTMQIDEIPLTSNGKVDKKKLPAPVVTQSKKGAEPANETEEALCSIFESVLKLDRVYADDDFFAVGGSSISAISAVVKCNNAGYNIVFKNLFANPTPHALSEFILGNRDETAETDAAESREYDSSALEFNRVEYVDEITSGEIGDVLLTGSTGFLGSHLLRELLDNTRGNVICLVRGKGDMDGETRFRMMMTYYFEDWYTESRSRRVTVVEGELGDADAMKRLEELHFDTVINSAANVKHFAAGDELMRDNYSGVENLISLAEKTGALLVQISSTSVSGEAVEGVVGDDYLFRECDLNVGQSLENKYIHSKYQAEQAIIDAISKKRIRGKIIRLGNLMARIGDSEFQVNAGSNGFLSQFLGFKKLAMFPLSLMDKKVEFSPIDSTAKAVVLLAGTNDRFTVFHAKNCNAIHYGYFISAMIKVGIDVKKVRDSVFFETYDNALKEEKDLSDFTTLIAYRDNGDGKSNKIMHQIESDTAFTVKALYRLGFEWPLISSEYLEKMVKTLVELGFFA